MQTRSFGIKNRQSDNYGTITLHYHKHLATLEAFTMQWKRKYKTAESILTII